MINKSLQDTKYQQCAVCNGTKHGNENEKVIVFIKTDFDIDNEHDVQEFIEFKNQTKSMVFEKMGLTISEVIPVDDIPKTNSGKAFRRGLTEKYNSGAYETILTKLNHTNKSQSATKQKIKIFKTYNFTEYCEIH